MSEHILLINYDFPPNQGIGGRRWGKLAKGLAKRGYVVHVIKADPIADNRPSTWSQDVVHPYIRVTSIPRTYPDAISHPGNSVWSKLRYRFAMMRLKRAVKGTLYDLSAEWDRFLIPACERICSEFPIKRIVATGAPWHMLYSIGKWNDAQRKLQYIVDFRDPWLHAKNYGMAQLEPARKAFEARKQAEVLCKANVILSPDPVILNVLADFAVKQSITTGRMVPLRHFYDEDDFSSVQLHTPDSRSPFSIVYGGDLYLDLEPELRKVAAFFQSTQQGNIQVKLDIYTDARVPDFLKKIPGINIHASAGKSFYEIASQAHALLILLPEHKKHEFTTKFYDFLPLHKPYLVATNGGAVAEFVEQQEMGYVWELQGRYPWYEQLQQKSFNFSPHTDIQRYSLSAATDQLITLFQ